MESLQKDVWNQFFQTISHKTFACILFENPTRNNHGHFSLVKMQECKKVKISHTVHFFTIWRTFYARYSIALAHSPANIHSYLCRKIIRHDFSREKVLNLQQQFSDFRFQYWTTLENRDIKTISEMFYNKFSGFSFFSSEKECVELSSINCNWKKWNKKNINYFFTSSKRREFLGRVLLL